MTRQKWGDVGRLLLYLFIVSAFLTMNMSFFLSFINYTEAEIRAAAPLTALNVIGLSVIIWWIDLHRRKRLIKEPVKKIQEGIDRVIGGDLSARIDREHVGNAYEYGNIIDGINKMIAELGSVETLRTDFISNVSHEMKTPIAVLQNYATLLQSPELPETDQREYAQKIGEQTRLLSGLITNILKLNKLENQQIFPEKKRYNLTEQVCECMLSFEDLWEQKELEIETELEDDVEIEADREMLGIVWNNLISNAIKFTEPGGRITLSVRSDTETVSVSVADTGCGMTEETAKNIFRKFYQGDTSRSTQGNGLGLALARRIVEIHGGIINVESAYGVGSVFSVILHTGG